MENEESWNTFARTGRVSDYLEYVNNSRPGGDSFDSRNSVKEERGQREGTSDGNGIVGSYHW